MTPIAVAQKVMFRLSQQFNVRHWLRKVRWQAVGARFGTGNQHWESGHELAAPGFDWQKVYTRR